MRFLCLRVSPRRACGCQAMPLCAPKSEPPGIPEPRPRFQWTLPGGGGDLRRRAQKAAAPHPGAVGTVATRGPALTEVQELLDGERRWREAGIALNLLGHRLLQQPPEQPHPRRGNAETSQDAQAAAKAGAAEPRGLGEFAKRAPWPPSRPRRRGCSRRSTTSSTTSSSRAPAGRPPARGFPRPRLRGRSQPPYVRGARGARGARGRTRWLLIGRCRPRFLLPECSRGRPPPSLPGPRQAQQVHLHPVPSRATSSAAERWRRYKGTGRRSGALALNPIRSAAQGPSPPKAPLPGGLPWIS